MGSYCDIFRTLNYVNGEQDLNASNVKEKIKKRLKGEAEDLYDSWAGRGFEIDYVFKVERNGAVKEISLIDVACDFETCVRFRSVTVALIEAGAKVCSRHLLGAAMSSNADIVKALLRAGASDGPNKGCDGNTILGSIVTMFGKDPSSQAKDCFELLIKHTLERNPDEKVPDSIKNNRELFNYWNACKVSNVERGSTSSAMPANQSVALQAFQSKLSSLKKKSVNISQIERPYLIGGILGTAVGTSLAERFEVSTRFKGALGGSIGVVIGGIFLWWLSRESFASTNLEKATMEQLNVQEIKPKSSVFE